MRISDWSSDVCSSDLSGEQVLKPGMAAGFPAGKGDGHHMVNNGKDWAVYLEVGNRSLDDEPTYPDIDLFLTSGRHGKSRFTKKNGEPYRSEEHTSELQSLMRISYAVFCLKKKKKNKKP